MTTLFEKIKGDEPVTVILTGQFLAYITRLIDARQLRVVHGILNGTIRPDQEPPGGGLTPREERVMATDILRRFNEGIDRRIAVREVPQ